MTQRQRILRMLEEAGPRGIRSDECIKDYMPRAAARVQELKDQGYPISSEREGKYVRWTLNVGVESDAYDEFQAEAQELPDNRGVTLDSGVAALAPSAPLPVPEDNAEAPPANPYDPWVSEAA